MNKLTADPKCPNCHGTGKIELFTSVATCDCLLAMDNDDYIDGILDVDRKWADGCCSCHISPPCGFCLRYADANLAEPEYCDSCGTPSPNDEALLYKCSKCGQSVCVLCLIGAGATMGNPVEYFCKDCVE